MKLFKEGEFNEVTESLLSKIDTFDGPETLEFLIKETILACESKLALVSAITPNDKDLGERTREMFLSGKTVREVNLIGVPQDSDDLKDIATKALNIDKLSIFSIGVIADGTKSPVIMVILNNE